MLVRYEVNFWDEMEQQPTQECGITGYGTNLGEAVNHICKFYGLENIIDIKVYECENILCDSEIKDMLEKE